MFRGVLQVLVLPNPLNLPARAAQRGGHPSISLLVRLELRNPIVAIAIRHSLVLRTAVPKAAVHKDSDACPGEYDVWTHPNFVESNQIVLAEAKTTPMEDRAQPDLRLGVLTSVCLADLRRYHTPGFWVWNDDSATQLHLTCTTGGTHRISSPMG